MVSANGEPLGERIIVEGRVLDEDGRPATRHADRNLAGECVRKIHRPRRQPRCADRSQFFRWRTVRDGRARALSIPHGQARCLSVGQPQQCLAAESHSFLAVRCLLCHATCHPDVFSRRSASGSRPDLSRDAARGTRSADWCFSLDATEEGVALGYEFNIVLRGR